MKLSELQVREKVPTGPPGDATSRLRSEAGPGPAMGWSLEADWDKRVVFASKGDQKLIVPFENAPYMRPEQSVAKAVKAKDAA